MFEMLAREDLFEGATPEAIAGAERVLGIVLPEDYRAFLQFSDGFNGEVEGRYLVLWGTDELVSNASGYDLLPPNQRQVLIGSNGGPTAFGIIDGRYVSLPFVAAGPLENEIRVLAADFAGFLQAIGAGEGW
jgi:SMI1 / KNR4 family (SUKH-1)